MKRRAVILGAGGYARVVISTLAARHVDIVGCIARDAPVGNWPSSVPYLGPDRAIQDLDPSDTILVNGVGSTNSTELRGRLFEFGKKHGFEFLTVVHPHSLIDPGVPMGEGVQVLAGAVVQCGVELGANSIVNIGTAVDHDCRIGKNSHLAPGVSISGDVRIGIGVHIGTGAVVIQGIEIGDNALVAAGAVVIKNVPAGTTVVGIPAKPLPSSKKLLSSTAPTQGV
jgi:UDP-perosamine 4-acetyltransferase